MVVGRIVPGTAAPIGAPPVIVGSATVPRVVPEVHPRRPGPGIDVHPDRIPVHRVVAVAPVPAVRPAVVVVDHQRAMALIRIVAVDVPVVALRAKVARMIDLAVHVVAHMIRDHMSGRVLQTRHRIVDLVHGQERVSRHAERERFPVVVAREVQLQRAQVERVARDQGLDIAFALGVLDAQSPGLAAGQPVLVAAEDETVVEPVARPQHRDQTLGVDPVDHGVGVLVGLERDPLLVAAPVDLVLVAIEPDRDAQRFRPVIVPVVGRRRVVVARAVGLVATAARRRRRSVLGPRHRGGQPHAQRDSQPQAGAPGAEPAADSVRAFRGVPVHVRSFRADAWRRPTD